MSIEGNLRDLEKIPEPFGSLKAEEKRPAIDIELAEEGRTMEGQGLPRTQPKRHSNTNDMLFLLLVMLIFYDNRF